jgi:hypothetical protein
MTIMTHDGFMVMVSNEALFDTFAVTRPWQWQWRAPRTRSSPPGSNRGR